VPLRRPQTRRALPYAALFILTAAILTTLALRTTRRVNDAAAKSPTPAPARQAAPEPASASTRPADEPEHKQEARRAATPGVKPEARSEKKAAGETRRAKQGAAGEIEFASIPTLEGEETEREGRSGDPDRPMRRTAPVSTSRAALEGGAGRGNPSKENVRQQEEAAQTAGGVGRVKSGPKEERLHRAKAFNGDLRNLPHRRPERFERPEREEPLPRPTVRQGAVPAPKERADSAQTEAVVPSLPAPLPSASFDGLDFANWGAGHPPDTVGDVGPTYYIQSINSSVGIFRKSDGVRVAAFTLNTFMSQGNFGNLCDTNNFGDPVVLYDTFEDRWVITDFAFKLDVGNNVVNPPGAFQCFAVSKSGDPVSGGWNFYSINTAGGLGDYPKFGIWPDGLYMTASIFGYPNGAPFQNPRAYAFNKAQMYAGTPTVQVVSFDLPANDFTVLPSNARLQTGTPPTGTPNYYVSTWQFTNALSVYKFHVDWDRISLSTFSSPETPLSPTSWPNQSVANAPSLGGNNLDVLQIRAMMQNQYTNLGGVESLWDTHTVRRSSGGFAAPRWYQLNVTGGTVAANTAQAATFDPDGANVIHRFMPSLAVDRMGDMALGYSTSSSTTKPAIKYAGRLAADPVNTFSQTEQLLIQGTGTQTGNCGSGPCMRWGDYSAMSLDPDGCTFWYTNEYYAVDGLNHQTRIGAFSFPGCVSVGAGGTVSGTVTDGTNPIVGATVALGSRTATTDASGVYSFTGIPAGTYPSITASRAGFGSSTATNVSVADAATTTQNFTLTAAPANSCPTDTTQADFQLGVGTGVELLTSPGDVKLSNSSSEVTDQVYNPSSLSIAGNLTATNWVGQTFRAGVTGNLTKFSTLLGLTSGTSGTITVEIRDLNGANPGNTVLATGTLGPVTNVGTAAPYTVTFATPAAVVAGNDYSVVLRTSVGNTVFGVRGSGNGYANGALFTTTTSGGAWTATTNDLYFTTYVTTPFAYFASGNLVSGTKDANPAPGRVTNWTTLSWTANTPANTSVSFQVAASNNVNGPFDFVGPDGTAATFFTTSGASLAQFKGFRYMKYKAILTTSDNQVTPLVNDVTVCFVDKQTQTISFGAIADKAFGEDFQLTATATSGLTVSYSASGDCTVTGDQVHLTGPGSCTITASQAGNGSYEPAPNVVQSFNITKGGTTTVLASDVNPSNTGQQVTLTATVSDSAASANATGTVNFVDTSNGNAVLCGSVSLTSGQAQCQTSTLTAGTHDIQAVYSGDGNFLTSTSNTLQQAVNPVLRVLDAKVAEPASGTSQMLFTFVLSAPAGSGGVTVTYATADDTGGANPATAGTDYTPVAATQLNFAPGEIVKVVGVPVLHDADAGEPDETFLLTLTNPSGATIGRAVAKGLITQVEAPGSLIISELRTRGPGGDEDDFVELYNNGDSPLTVSDPSGGYGLYKLGAGCDAAPVLVGVIPNGTVIPARGHYLLVGAGYGLGSYAAGNQTLTSDIEDDRSVALFSTANVSDVSSADRLDAVGFVQGAGTSAPAGAPASGGASALQKFRGRISILSSSGGMCNLFKEGTELPGVAGTIKEHSFFRKECDYVGGVGCAAHGNPKDTGDNAADFQYADTNPDMSGTQKLGAPGPENLSSPIRRDATMSVVLLDRTQSNAAPPNRVRTFSDPDPNSTFGALSIRRRVQNNTGGDVTRLRFRVVELTTFPSPPGTADLRVRSASDASAFNVHDTTTCVDRTSGTASDCTVSVKGTLLEEPPNQTSGGGYNSTLAVDLSGLPGGKLAAGQSVEVHFLLGIQQTGTFRFYIIVEALP